MKQKVLVDVRVTCDPPCIRWCRTVEERAKALENWARDFHEFIRDHRSQDPVYLNVKRVYQYQCSHCGYEWEEDADGPLCCNKAQDEWRSIVGQKA